MDHRCLYGHRVSSEYEFAVRNRVCPTCGATTVTLSGYQLARELTEDVALDGVDAFKVALHLERHYTLTPNVEAGEEAAEGDDAEPEPAPAPDGAREPWDEVAVVLDATEYRPEMTEAVDVSEALIDDDPPELEATTEIHASRAAAAAAVAFVRVAPEASQPPPADEVEEPTVVVVQPPRAPSDDELAPTLVSSTPINLAMVQAAGEGDVERSFFE